MFSFTYIKICDNKIINTKVKRDLKLQVKLETLAKYSVKYEL